jgi:YidC/Oxa1 family membrane protein insertase
MGGAILEVVLKKFPEVQGHPEPYAFNHLHESAILGFVNHPGLDQNTAYELVSSTPTEVVYRATAGKLEVTRTYRLEDPAKGGDPYRIRHETTFRNLSAEPASLAPAYLSVGTAALIDAEDRGMNLNVTTYDGSSPMYIDRSELAGGGFGSWFGGGHPAIPVLEKPGTIVWAGVKNQFFTSIYTPDTPGTGIAVRRVELPPFKSTGHENIGIAGAARFDVPPVAANGTAKLGGQLYVGPREYKRLAKFEHNEDAMMQYARGMSRIFLSGYVAPLENTLLNAAHRWVGNWGVAVILMTLMLKIVSLPFTLAASRSAKRMAKLQPEMKQLREKYKDNPQKQQMATMELFKQHKVNPVGGCIPVLITMPLFFGFYAMLSGAAELRFQPFLWAPDLSAPDTIMHLGSFPVNIMPLLMGVTMLVQMRLTPQPSVDNAQATMMKFMPLVFIAFCYNFSCALALYSTINGLFTIGQQLVINRMKDDPGPVGPGTAAATTVGSFGRPVKNVTPKKKKG